MIGFNDLIDELGLLGDDRKLSVLPRVDFCHADNRSRAQRQNDVLSSTAGHVKEEEAGLTFDERVRRPLCNVGFGWLFEPHIRDSRSLSNQARSDTGLPTKVDLISSQRS